MDHVLFLRCPECDKIYEIWADKLTNTYESLLAGYEEFDEGSRPLSHCFDCACRVFHGMEPQEYIEKKLKQICLRGCGKSFPAIAEKCPHCGL